MKRFNLLLAAGAILGSGAFLWGLAQEPGTIDATAQRQRPPRGRGPFPGSASAGHSAGFPIRLELLIPSSRLQPDGITTVDFVITNIGTESVKVPSAVVLFDSAPRESLTLWLTSDWIKKQYLRDQRTGHLVEIGIVWISAELDGGDDPKSFSSLAPSTSIRVHASSPPFNAGAYSFTAHAELTRISNGTAQLLGTADSEAVTAKLLAANPTSNERHALEQVTLR
jgi:hypothetical protein